MSAPAVEPQPPGLPKPDSEFLRRHTQIMLDSYRSLLGCELFAREGDTAAQAARLFDASFIVVSHGTQADPILNYGNRAALKLWEADWATLTAMPSRRTAEPLEREQRAKVMQRVASLGFVDDYRGVRISTTGRRFEIERATVWNLYTSGDTYYGQAAMFAQWTYLEPDPTQ